VIIYVETNFVLELVFEQEQSVSCKQILALCELGKAQIIIPAYCLAEPHEKLKRQSSKRKKLQGNLNAELQQLVRTSSYASRIHSVQDLATLLVQSNEEERQRFNDYFKRLIDTADIIPLTTEILAEASSYEMPYDLSPQDALVFTSVISHLRKNKPPAACFLNKNTKDFDNPDIVDELNKHNCKMIPRFDHGFSFVQAHLQS